LISSLGDLVDFSSWLILAKLIRLVQSI